MKWILAATLAGALVWLWLTGALTPLSDMDRLREGVESAGVAGPILFVAVVVALTPIFVAGPPIWLSGSIWPIPLAILYSVVAGLLASLLFFGLARSFGQDWAARFIPEKLRERAAKLEEHPLRTIIVLRLLLWINPAVDILIGVSGVRLRDYCTGSAITLIPITALHVIIPAVGIDLAAGTPDWLTAVVIILVASGLTIRFVMKRRTADSNPEG